MKTSPGEAREIQGEDKLHQKFRILQQDWETFKQSNDSKPRGSLRRYPTKTTAIANAFKLLDNSPRSLMSYLQNTSSHDAAREEIIKERRAAIESGKLKARRLFAATAEEETGGFDLVQESEERSVSSYGGGCCSFSGSSSLCVGEVEREEVYNLEVKREGCGGGQRWVRLIGWLSVALMVSIAGIICLSCVGGFGDDNEVMLIPT
ncbi:hypothetical protein NMG60_11004645 [Bertholletia excelsa]